MKCLCCKSDKVKKQTEAMGVVEYPLPTSQEIEKLWKQIRKGNVIAKQKLTEEMKGYVYTWVDQVGHYPHRGTLREIAKGALQQAMATFSGEKMPTWLLYCEKTVKSALLLYTTNLPYREEFVCEVCGYVMHFQR